MFSKSRFPNHATTHSPIYPDVHTQLPRSTNTTLSDQSILPSASAAPSVNNNPNPGAGERRSGASRKCESRHDPIDNGPQCSHPIAQIKEIGVPRRVDESSEREVAGGVGGLRGGGVLGAI
ncbi:hypothetical protein M758_7G039000 [Ceratodon purpureus]|uniref:Uncharacterized protein n=1 Tax=Ceratodon purpureus TaxID=3225 RepID=A0A8T0HAJ8_CERPU|nr:hypothetical protein KC19_7G041200 [Ceratodon purpureus]KAG0610102.1 hypothetical protein M758_7G039000 [Ceratodon purpureus]